MLTLHKTSESTEIARLYESERDKHGTPLYWHPKKEEKYKLGVEDIDNYLTSEEFRDYYRLSLADASAIAEALKRGRDVPDKSHKGLQNKFFKVKKDLNKKLFTEMDLGDSSQYLRVDFPLDNSTWTGLHVTIGSSGSGKTFHTMDMMLRNLNGPKRNRRQICYASTELYKDKTLKKLMGDKYAGYVTGIDLSDDAFEESEHNSIDEWYHRSILPKLRSVPEGGHIVLDDPKDSPAANFLLKWQNTAYRTLRHKNIGLTSIQHSMRGGRWSSQAYSSVKYVHTFPRGGGKGKLTDYLSKDIGIPLKKAREYVDRFAENGRVLSVRMHNPSCLIGPKGIILL